MNLDRPKNLGTTIDVTCSSRPVKIAYLVPFEESPNSHLVIDAVFYESYTRWAGAYTLIVPTDSKNPIDQSYKGWLKFFDPDFIYSYVQIDDDLTKELDALCCPIALLQHKIHPNRSDEINWRTFLCDWHHYIQPVSAITTLPSPTISPLFPLSPAQSGEITVFTQYDSDAKDRFFRDNFGTAFQIHNFTNPVSGLFKTLCLASPNLSSRMNVGTEKCTSAADALSAIGSKKVLPIVKFAMAHSGAIPKAEPNKWARSFNVFVGNTVLDRIHFWNARQFTPSYAATPGALIVNAEFFDDLDLLKLLGQYLNQNNFVGYGNGPYQATLRSYSKSQAKLQSFAERLRPYTYNAVSVPADFATPAIPAPDDLKNARFRRSDDVETIKVTEDSNTFASKEPAHFIYIPPRFKGITQGQWIVEVDVKRHNNLSKYSNVVESWILPRRRAVTQAFSKRLGKVTGDGHLALVPSIENLPFLDNAIHSQRTFELTLPSDETFFRHLTLDLFKYPSDDLRASIVRKRYQHLSISDKGQNLRGVISMFGSLYEAYQILTNKFWREVLRAGKDDSVRYLVYELDKLRSFLPDDRLTKTRLMQELNLGNIGLVRRFMHANLMDTLEQLVRSNVFHQVSQWRCGYCGHLNSRSFDNMRIRNSCDICEREHVAPIDIKWKYELNEFVHRSLVRHTGLPVLWTLGFLQDQFSRSSYWYLSEVDLFENYEDLKNKNEIDIVCVLDGQFHAVEVKRHVSVFVNKPGAVDKFVKVMDLLRPDVAMLSFEAFCGAEENINDIKMALAQATKEITRRIAPVKLVVIVADDVAGFNEHPPDLGWFGKRTQEFH